MSAFSDTTCANPGLLERPDAYAAGMRDARAMGHPALVCFDARRAYDEWTLALTDHGHTSFYGRERIQRSRCYWLGVLRGARASIDRWEPRIVR